MALEIDPGGAMPRAVLQSADFRGARVLEIGAGNGRLTFQYAAEPGSVVGIDTKEPEIRTGSQWAGAAGFGNVRLLCASATALPFREGQFGIVLLASAL